MDRGGLEAELVLIVRFLLGNAVESSREVPFDLHVFLLLELHDVLSEGTTSATAASPSLSLNSLQVFIVLHHVLLEGGGNELANNGVARQLRLDEVISHLSQNFFFKV